MSPARDVSLDTLDLTQDDRVLTARIVSPPLNFGTDHPLSRGLDLEPAGFLAGGSTRAAARTFGVFAAELATLGETPFLADPGPWIAGTKVDQTS